MNSVFLPSRPMERAVLPQALGSGARKTVKARASQAMVTATAALPSSSPVLPASVESPSPLSLDTSAIDPVLRLPKVLELTGCAESTWHRYVKQGLAPRGRRLGPNTVGWLLSDIQAWLQSRPLA